jgi:hypothetical protein
LGRRFVIGGSEACAIVVLRQEGELGVGGADEEVAAVRGLYQVDRAWAPAARYAITRRDFVRDCDESTTSRWQDRRVEWAPEAGEAIRDAY